VNIENTLLGGVIKPTLNPMKTYLGVKMIQAKPMNRLEYNEYRGWQLPADENGLDEGFLVEYLDGGASNHPDHKGYISWSPKEVFENAYKEVTGLSFGLAIEAAKLGKRIAREGWNGKGMFVFQRPADELEIGFIINVVKSIPESVKDYYQSIVDSGVNEETTTKLLTTKVKFGSYLCMYAADSSIVNGWLASQTDMLATDWCILD